MTDLYRRQASLELRSGATVTMVSGVRLAFKVSRDDTTHANLAEVKVYNLNETTRASIARGSTLDLVAGFVDVYGSIFRGGVYDVAVAGSGADIITTIKASDSVGSGSLALGYKGAVAWEVVAVAACRSVASSCGVRLGNSLDAIVSAPLAPSYPRGYACRGRALPELSRILAVGGLSVSVQSGDLQLVGQSVGVGPLQVISLTAASGLVGSPVVAGRRPPGSPPDKTPKGHVIKALLQSRIFPGAMVSVESMALTGQYRVKSIGHQGDTEGSEWFSEVEVYP